MQSLLYRLINPSSPLPDPEAFLPEAPSQKARPRQTIVCGGMRPPECPPVRVSTTDDAVYIYAWPSRGGVIILPNATHIDFAFLHISALDPLPQPNEDSDAEDDFCKRLLLLGAKWWDSQARHSFCWSLANGEDGATNEVDEGRQPEPTPREKRWVRVGWCEEPKDGLWVAEFDHGWYCIDEEDELMPENAAIVGLAKDMEERCELIKKMGGRFYESLESYEGRGFMRAWEWKKDGEVGSLVQHPGRQSRRSESYVSYDIHDEQQRSYHVNE